MVLDQICKFIWILFQIVEKIVCVEVCGRVFPAVLSRRIYRVHVVLGANRTADTAFGDLRINFVSSIICLSLNHVKKILADHGIADIDPGDG